MGKVVDFTGKNVDALGHLAVDMMFSDAEKHNFRGAMIMGITEDGEEISMVANLSPAEMVWLLEASKLAILSDD